jgi:hopanoid biosynthesis associated protein HpnK
MTRDRVTELAKMSVAAANLQFEIRSLKFPRRLIVNADDFGLSSSVNQAVVRAHREGILTSASLMVNEPGFDEAVKLAKENPSLGVGLHLTLLHGRSALPPEKIPGLVNAQKEFSRAPVAAGLKYFFDDGLRAQLRVEIHAQFEKFRSTGLKLDHVNGHLHFHLHPVIFKILMDDAEKLGITHFRLTRDCLARAWKISSGKLLYKIFHAAIFEILSDRAEKILAAKKIRHAQTVFGLLQDSCVDEEYLLKLLPELPPGDSELYAHPSLDKFRHEFDALVSPRVKEAVSRLGIALIRYQDL